MLRSDAVSVVLRVGPHCVVLPELALTLVFVVFLLLAFLAGFVVELLSAT
jgi:hypothetical protein